MNSKAQFIKAILFAIYLCAPNWVLAESVNNTLETATFKDPISWGNATNGISAGLLINKINSHTRLTVYVRRFGASVRLVQIGNVTNIEQIAPHYLGPTNRFVGPIELQDIKGMKVSLLKPSV